MCCLSVYCTFVIHINLDNCLLNVTWTWIIDSAVDVFITGLASSICRSSNVKLFSVFVLHRRQKFPKK